MPSPAAKAKNNIYGNAGGFNRAGSWVKAGLGNPSRRYQELMGVTETLSRK